MTSLDSLALAAIRFYQRRLSPYKGFRCACAALHGGESCSAAVARIIREDGLRAGRPRIAAQFARCRAAHDTIHGAMRGGSPLAIGTSMQAQGVCCIGPCPIPFRCG